MPERPALPCAGSEHDEIRQFLVMRDANGRLRSILVFDEGGEDKAHEAYCKAEARGVECCLFGTTDIATLARTHPNWLDCLSAARPGVTSGPGALVLDAYTAASNAALAAAEQERCARSLEGGES